MRHQSTHVLLSTVCVPICLRQNIAAIWYLSNDHMFVKEEALQEAMIQRNFTWTLKSITYVTFRDSIPQNGHEVRSCPSSIAGLSDVPMMTNQAMLCAMWAMY
jgi:hypothetical protein